MLKEQNKERYLFDRFHEELARQDFAKTRNSPIGLYFDNSRSLRTNETTA
jgi:hypothetical protein